MTKVSVGEGETLRVELTGQPQDVAVVHEQGFLRLVINGQEVFNTPLGTAETLKKSVEKTLGEINDIIKTAQALSANAPTEKT